MNCVDSSGWLEYLSDGPNADKFEDPLNDIGNLIVSAINIYEVFKVVLRESDENMALHAAALMQQGNVVDVNSEIALHAAKISSDFKIPMAYSIIVATARRYEAIIWTQDRDFQGIEKVKYFPKTQ